jgi:cytochrome b561
MQVQNSPERYGAIPKTFHWATVVLVIAGWLLGQFARLVWRFIDAPPPPETTALGGIAEVGAKIAHVALYALLVAIPIMGILVQFARGRALPVFGLWEIASPWVRDREFAKSLLNVHELMANTLVVLAALHGAAALVHHFVLGDRTLRRMLPGTAN